MSLKRAEELYQDFHKYNPSKVTKAPSSFRIPKQAAFVGPALYVLYRSSKYDPVTYLKPEKPVDYIHEHKTGVKVYLVGADEGPARKVPKYMHSVGVGKDEGLTSLGKCLGFGYVDEDGDEVEATCTGKMKLYSIPSGKGLIIVENDRKVVGLIWGGKLRVEPRGIVG